jgi:hypothetical protein
MKLLTALALMLLVMAASAQVAAPPPPQNDPFVGTWRENQGKSPPKPGKKDKSYIRTIARDGDDLVFYSRAAGSKPIEHNYRIRCDGLLHSVPFGSMSCNYTAPNVVEGESRSPNSHEGAAKTIFWKREVSADGQLMTLSGYEDSGRTKPLGSTEILYRVK